ncbi:MAG: cyclic nucleotide-binding domain-containing protein [Acidimicrobiia bacterium]
MNLEPIREKSNLLAHLPGPEMRFFESVATEATFEADAVLFDEGSAADMFYIIGVGRVALEIASPGKAPIVVQTLSDGELVGISWLLPPYRWQWRARALIGTDAVAFDAAAVRKECELDKELSLRVHQAVAAEAARRLHHTRLQLLDLYEKV